MKKITVEVVNIPYKQKLNFGITKQKTIVHKQLQLIFYIIYSYGKSK